MTYSILAVDTTTGTTGAAVASCVPLDVLERVYGAAPGYGAIVTQSYLLDGARDDGLAWLEAGASPAEVLASLTDPAYDPDAALRQYSVLDLDGGAARLTGNEALAYAADRGGEVDGIVFAIQGNRLTGDEVLNEAQAAFITADGCDLAERLFAALEAGGSGGLGDARCTPHGTPAKSAILRIDPVGAPAGSQLALAVEAAGDPPVEDPLALLEAELASWRASHACPSATPPSEGGGSTGSDDAGAPEASGCAVAGAADGGLAVALVFAWLARRAL